VYENERKYYKETVVRLIHCFQLPKKNILQYFKAYLFKNGHVFVPLFLSEPLKMFCGTLSLRRTLSEKHCAISSVVLRITAILS
jgi:hypothetical protein